ncbi:lipopolysaccharide biosynthesis protein [Aestuariibacter sp. AA17]|uniref:Lipopolysaccharide biosynthesis protein n=1 Tax=Fluctibacter corallii TaxID=2984329 RepID=A0ABT3ABI6_9ALTE|nr:lipopolysaccharide biosynthesis protein [Aestuariibacter sp. AA17]MCV2886039.1 lipopolysaccharide biosynthesis protein [Aestuariibacter sp. AA17]
MSLNKKIAIGAMWSVLTRVAIKGLGFISTLILARLLFPEDFGLMAVTMMMVAFFEIFVNFSFDVNIIQRDDVTNKTLNSAWTCKLIAGLGVAVCLLLSSGFIASFFNDDRLVLLVCVVAIIPLIRSAENIGFVLFRKELDLQKEFRLEVFSKLFSFTVTIAVAYFTRSYWALVAGMITNTLCRVGFSYLMHHYRPAFCLDEWRSLFSFSKWLLLNNLLIFFNHKITDLIIGNRTNPRELGFYSVGYEISNLPTTELVFPLSRAIFPGYSKVKNDRQALTTMFTDFTSVVVFLTAPISLGIYAIAPEAVPVLLGDKWLPAIPIIALLALYGFSRCAVQNIGSVFVAMGRPQLPVFISIFRLCLIVPVLLYYVDKEGAVGAAKAVCLVALVTTPVSYVICAYVVGFGVSTILRIFAFPVFAALGMYFAIEGLSAHLYTWFNQTILLILLAKVAIGVCVYGLATILFYLGAANEHPVNRLIHKGMLRVRPT